MRIQAADISRLFILFIFSHNHMVNYYRDYKMSESIDIAEDTPTKRVHPFKSMLTVSDNETVCITRVLGFLSGLTALALQAFVVINTGVFDIQTFGVGYGVLLGSIAGSVRLKDNAEPQG